MSHALLNKIAHLEIYQTKAHQEIYQTNIQWSWFGIHSSHIPGRMQAFQPKNVTHEYYCSKYRSNNKNFHKFKKSDHGTIEGVNAQYGYF